jgi:hypothetical protein
LSAQFVWLWLLWHCLRSLQQKHQKALPTFKIEHIIFVYCNNAKLLTFPYSHCKLWCFKGEMYAQFVLMYFNYTPHLYYLSPFASVQFTSLSFAFLKQLHCF